MAAMPVPGPVCAILSSDPFQLQHWNDCRARHWRLRESERGALVFLGDSITEQWKELQNSFTGITIANRGIGSDATAGVRFRLQEDVLDLQPRGVVLLLGTNDLAMQASAEATLDGITAILDRLVLQGRPIPVVLASILPRNDIDVRDRTGPLNRGLAAIAKQRHLGFADLHPALCGPDGSIRLECFSDGAHPNELGHACMHAVLAPLVQARWGGAAPASRPSQAGR